MNIYITYGIIFVILLALELCYFRVADKYNIIDKPNERSSHSTVVLRGGGIIFVLSMLVWCGLQGLQNEWNSVLNHLPFLIGLLLVAGLSFVDDIRSLPDCVRLVGQFVSMVLMFYQLGMFGQEWFVAYGWVLGVVLILGAVIVFVGATNVINFMDGVNGMTGAYALSVLSPLALVNGKDTYFLNSLVIVAAISVVVFCIFNFRPKGKAKCFAGDVGSIGVGFIMLFFIACVIIDTNDLTYLIFLLVYGIDGILTICHRIMLHENLGKAHRKHAYQIMANELKIEHVKVSFLYAVVQLIVSLGFIYICPNNILSHWTYLVVTFIVLAIAYVLFMKKYYHLHEAYLFSRMN